jgi:MmgE/PrpD N-terminal domain
MTTTDQILALAASAAPSDQADADLAQFSGAVARGERIDVVRALRALRPAGGTPALPDGPAWRAWLSATAAIASTSDVAAADPASHPGSAEQLSTGRVGDLTVRFVVCAAATALGDACSAAVDAGARAAALVESRLAGLADPVGWSIPAVSAVIGAGLAAGLMLRLTPDRLRPALGICATQAAGLCAAATTDAGPLQAGKAAFNAVEAAQLARLGFTSSGEPLDGRRALFALFAR